MVIHKLNQKEWAHLVAQGLDRHEAQRRYRRYQYVPLFRKYATVPLILGFLSILPFIYFWGFELFVRQVLGAFITITFVTSAIAVLAKIELS